MTFIRTNIHFSIVLITLVATTIACGHKDKRKVDPAVTPPTETPTPAPTASPTPENAPDGNIVFPEAPVVVVSPVPELPVIVAPTIPEFPIVVVPTIPDVVLPEPIQVPAAPQVPDTQQVPAAQQAQKPEEAPVTEPTPVSVDPKDVQKALKAATEIAAASSQAISTASTFVSAKTSKLLNNGAALIVEISKTPAPLEINVPEAAVKSCGTWTEEPKFDGCLHPHTNLIFTKPFAIEKADVVAGLAANTRVDEALKQYVADVCAAKYGKIAPDTDHRVKYAHTPYAMIPGSADTEKQAVALAFIKDFSARLSDSMEGEDSVFSHFKNFASAKFITNHGAEFFSVADSKKELFLNSQEMPEHLTGYCVIDNKK